MGHHTAQSEPDTLLPTRQSLLSRLRDLQDQAGWREFFERYWRLIYNVARASGLSDAAAQDVVQNTFIYLVRRMPNFRYDRNRGSFKSWLRVVTRSRIQVYCRTEKGYERHLREALPQETDDGSEGVEALMDVAPDVHDEVWQREWEQNLVHTALRRLRSK